MSTENYIVISRTDGSVAHMAFQMVGRFPRAPNGFWTLLDDSLWASLKTFLTGALTSRPAWATYGREPTDQAINHEVMRLDAGWMARGEPGLISWRRISEAEHFMFNEHRRHRDALEDAGGTIRHNMPRARELHRDLLRHQRVEKLMALDGQFNAARTKQAQDAIEAKRQALRDAPADPRIDAAVSVQDLLTITLPPV